MVATESDVRRPDADAHSPVTPAQVGPRSHGRWAHLAALAIGLVWLVAATAMSIGEHVTFNSTSRDFGVYLQMLWNTGHGQPFRTTLLESNQTHLAEHVALMLPVLAVPYALAPDPSWLFALQTTVLALSAVPIYRFARRQLQGVWLPTLVVAAYFAMPTLTEIAFDAVYPVTFAALPIAWAAYFLLTGRWRAGAACALAALAIEEEVGLSLLGLGLFAALRPAGRRWALALGGVGALWLVTVSMVVMPRFHDPSTLPARAENRTVGHFEQLRQDPLAVLQRFASERLPLAVRWLLAPTGGVALLAPQVLLMDGPHAAALLLADNEGRFRRHWASPMLPAIWLATVAGLARLEVGRWRAVGATLMVVGTVSTYLLDSNLPGGGDFDPADVSWTARAEQHRHLVERVSDGASVAASRRVLGYLANRPALYVFPPSYAGDLWPPSDRIEAYVFDLTNDQTRAALEGRQSPLRGGSPYAIWLAGPDAAMLVAQPPAPRTADGREVGAFQLLGYDVDRSSAELSITLHWRVARRPARGLSRTVTLVDAAGATVASQRGTGLDEIFPAQEWTVGQVVLDRVRLPAAGDGARLEVGWLNRSGQGERLSIGIGDAR